MKDKKVALSLVQPSGELTIGNYLGAIKNYTKLQDEYECYFAVADMHSITVPQVPRELRKRTKEVLATFLAVGLDPEKSTLFVQSHVVEHAQLQWVLNSISYMGQLSRMTQFKDKSKKSDENLNSALFTYPVLMAADILLYQADVVPVGEDQRQHMELARDLAERFNSKYSETFTVPEGIIDTKVTGKIMSLKDPSVKMSKSDEDENSYILLLDDEKAIRRKIKRAVTDSYGVINYSDNQPGIKNLINIYAGFSNEDISAIISRYEGKSYAEFKEDLADLLVEKLSIIQKKYYEIIQDKDYLNSIMKDGAMKAEKVARKTLSKVYRKVGFVELPR